MSNHVVKEVQVPKEIGEVFEAIVELAKDIKEKKNIAEIVSENLAGVMSAVDGFDKMGDELKSEKIYQAAGLFVGDLLEVLLKKEEIKEEAKAEEPAAPVAPEA